MNLPDTFEAWTKTQKFQALADKTKQSYAQAIALLIECYGRKVETEIVAGRIDSFIPFLQKKDHSGRTLRWELTIAKLFFKFAGFPVTCYYKIPRAEAQAMDLKHMKRWFDDKDIQMCLDYRFEWAKDPILCQIVVRILVETGVRIGELANVKWKDLNLGEGILTIEESKSVPRAAFFSPLTADLIRQYKKSLSYPVEGEMILIGKKQVEYIIKTMLVDLGIKKPKDGRAAHTFRHYCATRLFYIGEMRIEDIAFLLGDQPSTIANVYLHPTVSMLKSKVWKAMGWDSGAEVSEPQAMIDAKQALMKLGFSRQSSITMLSKVSFTPNMDAINIVQEALKNAN